MENCPEGSSLGSFSFGGSLSCFVSSAQAADSGSGKGGVHEGFVCCELARHDNMLVYFCGGSSKSSVLPVGCGSKLKSQGLRRFCPKRPFWGSKFFWGHSLVAFKTISTCARGTGLGITPTIGGKLWRGFHSVGKCSFTTLF